MCVCGDLLQAGGKGGLCQRGDVSCRGECVAFPGGSWLHPYGTPSLLEQVRGFGVQVLLCRALQEGSVWSSPAGSIRMEPAREECALPSCCMFASAATVTWGPGLLGHRPPEVRSLPCSPRTQGWPSLDPPWGFCPRMLKLCPALWVLYLFPTGESWLWECMWSTACWDGDKDALRTL